MLLDFFSLLFPEICISCDNRLYKGEDFLCMRCRRHLPKTNFHLEKENPVAKHFWGKVKIESAAACFFFNKGEKVQKMIHRIKYHHKKEAGIFMGKYYARDLVTSPAYCAPEIIVPVPLHRARKIKRGYNQSELFAKGIAEVLKKEVDTQSLVRVKGSATQTRKGRFDRWKNVQDLFEIKNTQRLAGRHILLVDDVITTGATLEACAQTILRLAGTKVSVVTIAWTQR